MEHTLANIEIELYQKNGKNYVFMSNDGSSGVKTSFDTPEQLRNIVSDYVEEVFHDNK